MGISIGLVGLGSFGGAFADLFKRHPLVSRVGLCDREADRVKVFAEREDWADKFDPADAYETHEAICKADFDALVVITQPWLHAPQCIEAMEAGKHVYSAVPISCIPDGDEILDWCDKLVRTAERTGQHYMLGETTFYRPEAMFCRRKVAEGAFGEFVYSEGDYLHPFDSPWSDLRKVKANREASASGQEWAAIRDSYTARGILTGPMHYPTHSTSGPICVMGAHAVKVCAWGTKPITDDPYFDARSMAFSNETALFQMSNGTTMRVCEFRELGGAHGEMFRVYGTKGSFERDQWKWHDGEGHHAADLTAEDMRDPLPDDVAAAWTDTATESVEYGGHGGSHAYLVHEFVTAVAEGRTPAVNVWEAVRYMAAGVMAHKSALKDGEVLDVPDWGDAPG